LYIDHYHIINLQLPSTVQANRLLLLASERAKGITETQATQDLVKTKAAEQTINEATQTETAQLSWMLVVNE
jgi:hypothetical protein